MEVRWEILAATPYGVCDNSQQHPRHLLALLHTLSHLILTATAPGRGYYFLHVVTGEDETLVM